MENKTKAPDFPSFDISPVAKMDADEHQPLDVHHQVDEPHQADEPQPQPNQVAKKDVVTKQQFIEFMKSFKKDIFKPP